MGFAEGYRRILGATSSQAQLYFGLTLFFAGAIAAVSALVILATGDLTVADTADRRELAGILAGVGMPALFFGLQLTLPSRVSIHVVAAAGAITIVVATFLFQAYYPQEWNQVGADRSADVVTVVVVGFVLLLTTTAMALVLNFVSHYVTLPGRERDDIFADPDHDVTIEEVMADIEKEVSKQGLTWGGMSKAEVESQLVKIKADFGAGAVISKGRAGKVVEFDNMGGEEAYRALLKMRGRDRGTEHEQDETGDAVAALLALRREAQTARERSFWYRFKRWVVSLFIGERPVPSGTERKNPKGLEGAGPKSAPTGRSGFGTAEAAELEVLPAPAGGRRKGSKPRTAAKQAHRRASVKHHRN